MSENKTPEQDRAIKLLITILERGKGQTVVSICRENGATFSLIAPSSGTAGSSFIGYLGLGDLEKDMVLTVVKTSQCQHIMNKLDEVFHFDRPYTGICFTIPIVGVSGPLALRYISGLAGIEHY